MAFGIVPLASGGRQFRVLKLGEHSGILCRACYGGVVRFRKNDGFIVSVGRSMLKRFQMDGLSLEDHEVQIGSY